MEQLVALSLLPPVTILAHLYCGTPLGGAP